MKLVEPGRDLGTDPFASVAFERAVHVQQQGVQLELAQPRKRQLADALDAQVRGYHSEHVLAPLALVPLCNVVERGSRFSVVSCQLSVVSFRFSVFSLSRSRSCDGSLSNWRNTAPLVVSRAKAPRTKN